MFSMFLLWSLVGSVIGLLRESRYGQGGYEYQEEKSG